MTEFQVGDRVRAAHKKSEDVAEFTVTEIAYDSIETDDLIFFTGYWNFELIERPYKLPTKPGLYQVLIGQEAPNDSKRIFYLSSLGGWEEFGSGAPVEEDELRAMKWPLKRLVFED